MKSLFLSSACALVITSLSCVTASARDLDTVGEKVTKTEIRHGQIGPRDTIIFYTFANDAAVLQLNIRNEAGKFILSGQMQLFAEGTNAEQMGKWINNQHSCGLFPDVPEPKVSHPLPADACTVLESKLKEGAEVAVSRFPNAKFSDYSLKIKIANIEAKGFKLKGFTADTGAFVKAGPAI
jgi:hypothetical protein